MGLYTDQTNSLSELKRLAVMVMDESRRGEIGSDQWPLAIIAYGLVTCNDASRLEEGIRIYREFSSACPADVRFDTCARLAEFIRQRQGNGWRALLAFATADEHEGIRRQAAFLAGTLAPPDSTMAFAGFAELVRLLISPALPGQQHNAPLLDALLGTADLRLLELADSMLNRLADRDVEHLLAASRLQPNALSCEWLLHLLERKDGHAGSVADLLERRIEGCGEIVDVILPIPSWAFKNASAQPLHGWTPPEYFERMRPRLARRLSEEQLLRVEAAWQAVKPG